MPNLSRRQFLADSFFAAALASITTSPVTAGDSSRRRVSQNDKLQVAVIGVRGRGGNHVSEFLRLPDVEIVAICDVDSSVVGNAVKAIEQKQGKPPIVYQDLRKLYENKEIDAVSMALPIHWHSLAALWAMQAGKDVYVEKPVSHNVSEGRRLVEASAKYGRICQAGTQSRSSKATQDAIRHVHEGKIGTVTLSRGLCYKLRKSIGIKEDAPVPAGVDYDLWLGPAAKRPFNPNRFHYEWHWMWDYGTGDLGNQGIHQMDIARWALNKSVLPNSVYSFGGRYGYTDQGETPNTLCSVFDYGDTRLIFEVRGLPGPGLTGVTIGDIVYGSEGYVVFTSNYGAAAAFDKDGNKTAEFQGGGNHFSNFVQGVKSRQMSDLNAPVVEGHLSSALCHLGNISYRLGTQIPASEVEKSLKTDSDKDAFTRFTQHLTENQVPISDRKVQMGRFIELDPKKESVRKDKAAEKLLTREYRAPFVVPAKLS